MEIEHQLSSLFAMVQTQQAGQEELGRGLKSGVEGLATCQHEQIAHLEGLARRQEARVEELIERQNTCCTEIEQRQLKAQAVVENLREDLATVKEVINSRIQATETKLAGLYIGHSAKNDC